MIVLDTNVISEPLKRSPDPGVLSWLDQQGAETLFLTTTSLSELLLGIELLPKGKRKQGLDRALSELISYLFGDRILDFDRQAALVYAPLVSQARSTGRTISIADGQIAAVAKSRGYSVASRDTMPFTAAGLTVINPWQEEKT
ncbi:type II toxin-antitoxin system VapC family toxin [Phyllobacterium pellucidum]|uniref:type II toxin-antitoxin system VapC family toxin n=1 Tax=Phyllobacterium pellucidum TaxID=2740464 RepID=UPI001D158163|nr:type II toxin-antitoxin system VapC family toxin [Phyllobacterium sp. T1018]UGY10439.1 type II toxin-antitoxin system VapC family toxin [Phyllobacterium sp. T1018]